ncbi:hypothetical protein ACK2M7_12570 [Chryseobacterium sp. TY4]
MAVANKIFSDGKRVLQKRNSAQKVIFNDADIIMSVGYSVNLATRTMSIVFDKKVDAFFRFNNGLNAERILEFFDSDKITKNLNPNEDGNGDVQNPAVPNINFFKDCHIFLRDKSQVNKITTSSNNGNIWAFNEVIKFSDGWNNLTEIDASNFAEIGQIFIQNLPRLKILKLKLNRANSTGLSGDNFPLNSLNSNSLQYLYFSSAGGITNITALLPTSLRYLSIIGYYRNVNIDLKNFYTGNRIGLSMSNGFKASYSGGAIFPATISDDSDYPIDYILYLGSSIDNKITGDEFSRFILDFANQVKSVTTVQKRIRCVGVTANTSYTDNSQPLYKTYTAALNYITTTLGVTVQFT